jgi:hypothetical protein
MSLAWPTLDEGKWNLIATNVVTGNIERLKSQYKYWGTEVPTGDPAPANTEEYKDKNPILFEDGNTEAIESQVSIDVYVWIENAETDFNDTNIEDAIRVNS